MTGWTTSIASTATSPASERIRTASFKDAEIPYVSGEVCVDTHTLLYEAVSILAYFDTSIDFLSVTPINVTVGGAKFHLTSSVGELPFNSEIIGQDLVTTNIVNASFIRIKGSVAIRPVVMQGNVSLGFSIEYWVHTTNQTQHGGWGDLYMFPVTVVPSILRPDGWIYANGVTIIVGIIVLTRYSMKRIQKDED